MDEDGDKEWTNVVTYCATSSFPVTWLLNPLHLMTNGNWLMHSGDYLCKVDPHNPPTILCSYTVKTMDIPPKGKYVETLVSPNQYMKQPS